jgi:hypothetical protein
MADEAYHRAWKMQPPDYDQPLSRFSSRLNSAISIRPSHRDRLGFMAAMMDEPWILILDMDR